MRRLGGWATLRRDLDSAAIQDRSLGSVAFHCTIDTIMRLLTTREASQILKVTPARVRQLVALGRLAGKKLGRDILIDEDQLDAFRCSSRPGPGRPPQKK